jgi:hypothetical protein
VINPGKNARLSNANGGGVAIVKMEQILCHRGRKDRGPLVPKQLPDRVRRRATKSYIFDTLNSSSHLKSCGKRVRFDLLTGDAGMVSRIAASTDEGSDA